MHIKICKLLETWLINVFRKSFLIMSFYELGHPMLTGSIWFFHFFGIQKKIIDIARDVIPMVHAKNPKLPSYSTPDANMNV